MKKCSFHIFRYLLSFFPFIKGVLILINLFLHLLHSKQKLVATFSLIKKDSSNTGRGIHSVEQAYYVLMAEIGIVVYCIYSFLYCFSQHEPFRSAPDHINDTLSEFTR